jgi:hypothetical protein
MSRSFLVEKKSRRQKRCECEERGQQRRKDEIIQVNNITKLSYRDVLVKGRADKNKNIKLMFRHHEEHRKAVYDLICKRLEATV